MTKKPHVFIASSVEGLEIAEAIQGNLHYDAECQIWTQDAFCPTDSTLNNLQEQLEQNDFAVFVCTFDDILQMREQQKLKVVRDNVIFELGLFMGHLGRSRCFIVCPDEKEFHLPSDIEEMKGTMLKYPHNMDNKVVALGPASRMIKNSIKKMQPACNVSGKWLHIHTKEELRIGRVEFWQKGNAIIKADGLNVTPANTPLKDKVTEWKYTNGFVQEESSGDVTLIGLYDADCRDGNMDNDGVHILSVKRDENGQPYRMNGKFQDILKRAEDSRISEHTGGLQLFRMSGDVENYLAGDEEEGLRTLYLQPRFKNEPFVKELCRILRMRKML